MTEFFKVYMPYCLDKQEDGSWVVLNREYKPLGFLDCGYIHYEEYPISCHLSLTEKRIDALSGSRGTEAWGRKRIYLYGGGNTPYKGKDLEAYMKRLEFLSRLMISKHTDNVIFLREADKNKKVV
jgi:hypothetical protein